MARDPAMALSGRVRALAILACVLLWYTASISITFANKHLLTARGFHFPFFMTASNNALVSLLAFILTRHRRLRQPALSRRSQLWVVFPIGAATALDIGFSNWSLELVSVSFHVILKGTIPAFVLMFAITLGLERRSLMTFGAVVLVGIGISLAATGEVHFSFGGLVLGMLSASFGGLRWALIQLLIQGRPQKPLTAAAAVDGAPVPAIAAAAELEPAPAEPPSHAPARGTKDSHAAEGDDESVAGVARVTADASAEAVVSVQAAADAAALSRRTNPLGSVLYMSPVCAMTALLLTLICEQHLVESPVLHDSTLLSELLVLLLVVAVLVFVLLMAEFALVQLTSSLSLSILGILKEFVTILLAGWTRHEAVTPLKVVGFLICSSGAFLYHLSKARPSSVAANPSLRTRPDNVSGAAPPLASRLRQLRPSAAVSTVAGRRVSPWKKLSEETEI